MDASDAHGALLEDVDDYIAYISRVEGLSPETARAYGQHLEAYAAWCRAHGIDGLNPTARDIRAYLAEFRIEGRSPRTIAAHLSALRSLFRWLGAQGRKAGSVPLATAAPKQGRELPHVLTPDELDAIMRAPDLGSPEGLRDAAMLELFIATGARISELARLETGDVDTSERLVRLFGKGSKERIVPIYGKAVSTYERYVREGRPELLLSGGADASECRAVFISKRGKPMDSGALRYRFDVLRTRAGIPSKITPHSMRHTYATELLAGGADLRTVQELLGHASLSTTQVYTHLTPDRLKSAVSQAHPRG